MTTEQGASGERAKGTVMAAREGGIEGNRGATQPMRRAEEESVAGERRTRYGAKQCGSLH